MEKNATIGHLMKSHSVSHTAANCSLLDHSAMQRAVQTGSERSSDVNIVSTGDLDRDRGHGLAC